MGKNKNTITKKNKKKNTIPNKIIFQKLVKDKDFSENANTE